MKKRVAFKHSVWEETIRIDAIKRAALFLQHSEVYRLENITDNFESIITETTNNLIRDCDYDDEQNVDENDSDDYSIIEIDEHESLILSR